MGYRRLLLVVIVLVGSSSAMVGPSGPATAQTASGGEGLRGGFSPGSRLLWESDADLARDLDSMAGTGARWVRLDFAWSSIEATRGVYDWSRTDRAVDAARTRGMEVVALPAYTPAWARPAGTTDKHPPADPALFAAFVRSAVQRYAGRIGVWEIWNEPNIAPFWAPRPDPGAYTALLRAAAGAVRGADPTATVLSGGLSPAVDAGDGSQLSPVTFLGHVYAAGGGDSFDAVGMHPYSFPARPMDPTTAGWNTFYRLPLVYDVMVSHGDAAKKIWATEYGAPTGTSSQAVSEADQAAMVTEAYDAIAQWPWAGPLLWYAGRDTGTDGTDREQNFGLLRLGFEAKPAMATFTTAMKAAAVPAPLVVSPTSVQVVSGTLKAGDASALAGDDDAYLSVRSKGKPVSSTAWKASMAPVSNTLTTINVSYRGKASSPCTQTVSMWNWTTARWVVLDSRPVGTSEVAVDGLSPGVGTPADFVEGREGPGQMVVRVRCESSRGLFVSSGDRLQVAVGA